MELMAGQSRMTTEPMRGQLLSATARGRVEEVEREAVHRLRQQPRPPLRQLGVKVRERVERGVRRAEDAPLVRVGQKLEHKPAEAGADGLVVEHAPVRGEESGVRDVR